MSSATSSSTMGSGGSFTLPGQGVVPRSSLLRHMARFHRAPGACPACDRSVPRLVSATGEAYLCPTHGRLEYGPGRIPLEALGHVAHALADLTYSQPLTGLELVH